jgi:hypothetical protein
MSLVEFCTFPLQSITANLQFNSAAVQQWVEPRLKSPKYLKKKKSYKKKNLKKFKKFKKNIKQ